MVHYAELIRSFGAPNGICSSITEAKHIKAVKEPWRRSNRNFPLDQILEINQRLDKLAAARIDFTRRGMLENSALEGTLEEIGESVTMLGIITLTKSSNIQKLLDLGVYLE
jgi:uncharacterized protein with von Willebrand factor type A (vWA) domain